MKNPGGIKFSKTLAELIKKHSTPITQIAKETGLAKSSIFDWTTGRTPRNFRDIQKLADYFQVSVHYLIFGEEDPTSTQFESYNRLKSIQDHNEILTKNWIEKNVSLIFHNFLIKLLSSGRTE